MIGVLRGIRCVLLGLCRWGILSHAFSFLDEVFVFDDRSDDDSAAVAESAGASPDFIPCAFNSPAYMPDCIGNASAKGIDWDIR